MSITVTGLIRSETDKAILLRIPVDIGVKGHQAEVWFPRSQISYLKKEPTSKERLNFNATINIPEWLADKNAVIADDMLPDDYWEKETPQLELPLADPPKETPPGLGMITTVLATQLVEAYAKDEDPAEGGFDISAGLFGTHVSAWVKGVADHLATSYAALRAARVWMGERPKDPRTPYDISAAKIIDALDAALEAEPSTTPSPE